MAESTGMRGPGRKPLEIQKEIEDLIGTFEGVSRGDLFRLGGLVREYAESVANKMTVEFVADLAVMLARKDGAKEPWRGPG
jgi:hypothetical protein